MKRILICLGLASGAAFAAGPWSAYGDGNSKWHIGSLKTAGDIIVETRTFINPGNTAVRTASGAAFKDGLFVAYCTEYVYKGATSNAVTFELRIGVGSLANDPLTKSGAALAVGSSKWALAALDGCGRSLNARGLFAPKVSTVTFPYAKVVEFIPEAGPLNVGVVRFEQAGLGQAMVSFKPN
jgi:hypothetical protein